MKNIPNKLLMEICPEIDDVSEIDLNEIMQKVKSIKVNSKQIVV